jgi:hypothetical protein
VTGEEAAGEGARLVTADALEQEGKVKPARWLRLEARHEQAADVQVAEELRSLTTALEPRFVASFVRARLGRCGLLAPDVVRCPGQWAELPATGEPMTRYCVGCDASVQLCLTKDDAEKTFLSGKVLAKPNWV